MDKRYQSLKRISYKFIEENSTNFSIEEFTPEIDEDKINYLKLEKANLESDTELINLCREDKSNIDILMCIRSRVSHSICRNLFAFLNKNGGDKDDFNNTITFVLEDDGQRYYKEQLITKKFEEIKGNSQDNDENNIHQKIYEFDLFDKEKDEISPSKISTKNNSQKSLQNNFKKIEKSFKNAKLFANRPRRRNFDYSVIEDLEKKRKGFNLLKRFQKEKKIAKNTIPFCAEIIFQYNPERKSNLDTWTYRKVQTHLEIKKYMRDEMKLSFHRDWSLLAKTGVERLIKSMKMYGNIAEYTNILEDLFPERKIKKYDELIQIIRSLLESYKEQYSKTKETKSKSWEPKSEFLSKLFLPLKDEYPYLYLLKLIADAQRKHADPTIETLEDSREENYNAQLTDNSYDPLDQISDETKKYIRFILEKEVNKSMKNIILESKKKWPQKPIRKQIWIDLAKGYGFPNEIAERNDVTKSTVSKEIKRKLILERAFGDIFNIYIEPMTLVEIYDIKNFIEENNTKYFKELNITNEDKKILVKDIKEIFINKVSDQTFIKNAENNIKSFIVKTSKDKKETIDSFFSEIAKDILNNLGIY